MVVPARGAAEAAASFSSSNASGAVARAPSAIRAVAPRSNSSGSCSVPPRDNDASPPWAIGAGVGAALAGCARSDQGTSRHRRSSPLELLEPRLTDGLLQRAAPVELVHQARGLGAQVGRACAKAARGREDDFQASKMAKHEGPVSDLAYGAQDELLGLELEVDGTLGENPVLELERALTIAQQVAQDPLDLGLGRLAQLLLRDEAGVGQDLGQRVPRTNLALTSSSCSGVSLPPSMRMAPS